MHEDEFWSVNRLPGLVQQRLARVDAGVPARMPAPLQAPSHDAVSAADIQNARASVERLKDAHYTRLWAPACLGEARRLSLVECRVELK